MHITLYPTLDFHLRWILPYVGFYPASDFDLRRFSLRCVLFFAGIISKKFRPTEEKASRPELHLIIHPFFIFFNILRRFSLINLHYFCNN